MSVCELTSEPSALSAALWLIVKEDDVDKFPHAVQIAIKLFKTLPNLISPNAFCDMILDLKIKALIPLMSEEEGFNHAKVFSLLNSLFPVKEEDTEIKSSKYWSRHRRVRTRLLQLLAEDESRLIYVRDYLKYGSCGCLTRVIQERVKQFIDVVNQHIETVEAKKSVVTPCNDRSSMATVSLSSVNTSLQVAPTSKTKLETPDIESKESTKTKPSNKCSVSPSGHVKGLKQDVEHLKQQVPDAQSNDSISGETTVRSNHDRNETQTGKANVNEHNECKRPRLQKNEEIVAGASASPKCIKEKKDSSMKGEESINDIAVGRECTNQTAEQLENSNSPQESTVRFGIPGTYSSCAMT